MATKKKKTKWGLVIEGTLHAGKSIKWRNSLPSLGCRLPHKSRVVDMNAALFVKLSLLRFYRKLSNSTTVVSLLTKLPPPTPPRACFMTCSNPRDVPRRDFPVFITRIPSLDSLAADAVTRVFVSTERPIG